MRRGEGCPGCGCLRSEALLEGSLPALQEALTCSLEARPAQQRSPLPSSTLVSFPLRLPVTEDKAQGSPKKSRPFKNYPP